MRTVFVNPSKPRKRRRKAKRRSRPALRRAAPIRRKPRRRARRRNAGITPFVSQRPNPLMRTYRRKRARRRNPDFSLLTNPKKLVVQTLTLGGGAAVGVGVNILALRNIENVYFRNGARVLAAIVAGILMPGVMGASAGGALLSPALTELALLANLIQSGDDVQSPAETQADLNELGMDLSAALNELQDTEDDLLYVP